MVVNYPFLCQSRSRFVKQEPQEGDNSQMRPNGDHLFLPIGEHPGVLWSK